MTKNKEILPEQHLANQIKKGKLQDGFTARDVQRKQWSRLTTNEAVQAALDWLEDANWIKSYAVFPKMQGGRGTTAYRINPKIQLNEEIAI